MKKWFIASLAALSFISINFSRTEAFAATAQTTHAAPTQTVSVTSVEQKIVDNAISYIGKVHYKFGVRDTQKLILDCSAFTQLVFKNSGISIPWGSRAQAQIGTLVKSKSDLRVGDLVMFSIGTPGKISHVGIYIGDGKFINNQPGVGVNIKSLDSGYFKNRFILGRHVV
ncbi:NlpC/P60 family protein [Cohnella endophytica]|uniref:NlpC/P60 family protein n=1 Tax=Cohnella endophytica TaxID=2419778 RepID=A0A494Y458_9BACL|nr:C40 family peptidase [Cohnella endophytica]RKP56810.1 NlpC/P60 family protein [Cohnella endophytica]